MSSVHVESYEDLSRPDKVELIPLIYHKNHSSSHINAPPEYTAYLKRGSFLKFKKCPRSIDFFKISYQRIFEVHLLRFKRFAPIAMHKTYMLSHVCANVQYISIYVSHMPYTSVNFFQCHGNTETSR